MSRHGTRWGGAPGVRGFLTAAAALGGSLLATRPDSARAPAAPLPILTVDPNHAPPAILRALPQLGPKLVARIVQARQTAPFQSVDDLDFRVRGIGPVTINQLRPYLRIDPAETPPTVNP